MTFFISFFVTGFLIFIANRWGFGIDKTNGEQKFHKNITPRVGGIAIYFSIIFTLLVNQIDAYQFFLPLTLLFFFTLYEDLIDQIKAIYRLIVIFITSFFLVYINSFSIKNLGIPILDGLLENQIFNIFFTVTTIALVVNAFNIIDGFNGLLSGYSIVVLIALIFVSFSNNNQSILYFSTITLMAILGFFVWNFPFGKVFLGDSGAYFLGMIISYLVLKLVHSSDTISNWYPLALLIYPVFEVIFSVVRKKLIQKKEAMKPDGLHLHMLIFKKVINCKFFKNQNFCNSATSIFLWLLASIPITAANYWYGNSLFLFLISVFFIILYSIIYIFLLKSKKDI